MSARGQSVLAAPEQSRINIPEHAVKGVTLQTQQALRACWAMNSARQGKPMVANISPRMGKNEILPASSAYPGKSNQGFNKTCLVVLRRYCSIWSTSWGASCAERLRCRRTLNHDILSVCRNQDFQSPHYPVLHVFLRYQCCIRFLKWSSRVAPYTRVFMQPSSGHLLGCNMSHFKDQRGS